MVEGTEKRIDCVCPGYMATPMWDSMRPKDQQWAMDNHSPFGAPVDVQDMAEIIVDAIEAMLDGQVVNLWKKAYYGRDQQGKQVWGEEWRK